VEFYPKDATIPTRMSTGDVLLRPLRASDAEADLEALMASREMLRVWDQSDWPSDDFRLEENRDDLAEHEADHEAGRAFTYTVVDANDGRCVACVYVYPLESTLRAMGADDTELKDVGDHEAYVTFWVRESELSGGLERRLLDALVTWFDDEWSFRRLAFGSNTADTRQLGLLKERGFRPEWEFPVPSRDASYVVLLRDRPTG